MRSDYCGAIGPFARARLRQLHGQIPFHAGLIFEAQFLGVVRDAPVSQPHQRREPGSQFPAALDELVSQVDQFVGKAFERRFVERTLFEQGVAGAERLCVSLQ